MNAKEFKAKKRKDKKTLLDNTKEAIKVNNRFWCDRRSQFMNVEVCISRQDKGADGCVSCAQGKVVKQETEKGGM